MMVNVNNDDLRLVLMVACETEDRGVDEQRAMLRCAFISDTQRMKRTVTNPTPEPSIMVATVLSTVDADSDGASVRLAGDRMQRHAAMLDALRADEAIAAGKLRPDEA